MSTSAIELPTWIVDDDIEDYEVQLPITNCFKGFISSLMLNRNALVESEMQTASRVKGLRPQGLRWVKWFEIPHDQLTPPPMFRRALRICLFGLEDWDPLIKFFSRMGQLNAPLSFPSLVLTDLYKGQRALVEKESELLALPGAQLALACAKAQVPCIVFTSGHQALDDFRSIWQSLPNEHHSYLLHHPREHLGLEGQITTTLARLWRTSLHRLLGIPEFECVLSGTRNRNAQTFTVTFSRRSGDVVSQVTQVPAVPYAHLYLWAYASRLAALKQWSEADLEDINTAKCPVLSPQRKISGAAELHNMSPNLAKLFPRDFPPADYAKMFVGHHKKGQYRSANILNANIAHLDIPCPGKFPSYWAAPTISNKILSSMREVLPQEGLTWLQSAMGK